MVQSHYFLKVFSRISTCTGAGRKQIQALIIIIGVPQGSVLGLMKFHFIITAPLPGDIAT